MMSPGVTRGHTYKAEDNRLEEVLPLDSDRCIGGQGLTREGRLPRPGGEKSSTVVVHSGWDCTEGYFFFLVGRFLVL